MIELIEAKLNVTGNIFRIDFGCVLMFIGNTNDSLKTRMSLIEKCCPKKFVIYVAPYVVIVAIFFYALFLIFAKKHDLPQSRDEEKLIP